MQKPEAPARIGHSSPALRVHREFRRSILFVFLFFLFFFVVVIVIVVIEVLVNLVEVQICRRRSHHDGTRLREPIERGRAAVASRPIQARAGKWIDADELQRSLTAVSSDVSAVLKQDADRIQQTLGGLSSSISESIRESAQGIEQSLGRLSVETSETIRTSAHDAQQLLGQTATSTAETIASFRALRDSCGVGPRAESPGNSTDVATYSSSSELHAT